MPPDERLSRFKRHTRHRTSPGPASMGRTEEDRTVDLVRLFDACLHSLWLLPVLAVMIAADGPVPVLPSETILMSAAAAAFGIHDVRGIVGLFAAALVGSIAGDIVCFWLGRCSNRFLPAAARADCGLAQWVKANLFRSPVVALVGARLLPGGRLVSTAAAGRVGLPLRRFLPGSLVSSCVWSVYMLADRHAAGPDRRRQPVPEPGRRRGHGGADRRRVRAGPAAAGPPPSGAAGRGASPPSGRRPPVAAPYPDAGARSGSSVCRR